LPDPNFQATEAEYREQIDFLLAIRDKFSEVMKSLKAIRAIRQQMNDFVSRNGKSTPGDIRTLIDSIQAHLTSVEEELHQTRAKSGQDVLNYPIRLDDKLASVYRAASTGGTAPSRQVREAYTELAKLIDIQTARLKQVTTTEVGQLNQLIHEKALPVIGLKNE